MRTEASTSTTATSGTAPLTRKLTAAGLMTAIGAIVLIGSEIWLAAFASLWAFDGFFNLSTTADIILAALILPPAAWATWKVVVMAISAESDPENA